MVRSQKNHVNAADVVSLPASKKLITMSVTNFSSELPDLRNLDNKSSVLFDDEENLPSEVCIIISCFFSFTIELANSLTSKTACLSLFSDPMLRNLRIFHRIGKNVLNLLELNLTASSKAAANLLCGKDGDKYSGSYPKEMLHILSNANLWSISWRSRTV